MIEKELRGKVARFDLSVELLLQALQFPAGAQLERMHMSNSRPNAITIVVSHPDFEESYWGDIIPEIIPWAHYENGRLIIEWKDYH